jgi:hypothetical protein
MTDLLRLDVPGVNQDREIRIQILRALDITEVSTIPELGAMLRCPSEDVNRHVWYLAQAGSVTLSADKVAITPAGVDVITNP